MNYRCKGKNSLLYRRQKRKTQGYWSKLIKISKLKLNNCKPKKSTCKINVNNTGKRFKIAAQSCQSFKINMNWKCNKFLRSTSFTKLRGRGSKIHWGASCKRRWVRSRNWNWNLRRIWRWCRTLLGCCRIIRLSRVVSRRRLLWRCLIICRD